MSDSDSSGTLKMVLEGSDYEKSKKQSKRCREIRVGDSLKVILSQQELQYRNQKTNVDVISDFSNLIFCTRCQFSFKNHILEGKKVNSHPLLKVLMCETCCEFYGNGEFSLDEDNEDKYCRWCGEGGQLFLCSSCICGFCPKCIKKHFGKVKLAQIKKDDDWKCFICNPKPLWKLRYVCDLAIKEADSRRNQNCEGGVNGLEKTPRTKDKEVKQNNGLDDVNRKSKGCLDNSLSFRTSGRKSFQLKRKRNSKYRVRDNNSYSSSTSEDRDKPEEPVSKRIRITRSKKKGTNGDYKDLEKSTSEHETSRELKKYSSSSSSFSSDCDSEREVPHSLPNTPDGKNRQNPYKAKVKNMEKLKEILKVTEITSELCLKMCRKKGRKFARKEYFVSDGKLMSECEKLKSIIILMSSSLSTVHNLIISLQRKCGIKGIDKTYDFHGTYDTSLLENMNSILRDKRVKTSHLVNVVGDILNRYPCLEIGPPTVGNVTHDGAELVPYNNSLTDVVGLASDNATKLSLTKENINSVLNNENCQNKMVDFGLIPEENEQGTVIERPRGDSDTSTEIFDLESRIGNMSEKDSENGVDSDFDVNVKKMYDESLKLKKQLLKCSSDEMSVNDHDSGDSMSINSEKKRRSWKKKKKEHKEKLVNKQKQELSKEERELNRLLNLNTLERKQTSQDSEERSGQIKKKPRREEKAMSEGSKMSDDVCFVNSVSSNTYPPVDHKSEIDFLKQNAVMLKNYILESTSSAPESEQEAEEKEEKVDKKEKSSSTKKRVIRSRRSDRFLKCSISSDEESEYERKRQQRKPVESSSWSGEESTDSWTSWKHRKNRVVRKITTTSSEDSDSKIDSEPKEMGESPSKGRRAIRKILKKESLQLETRQAIRVENERKKRIAERNESYKRFFPDMEQSDRLVLDFEPDTGEVLLEVPRELVKELKPHQKKGIKFMWDCCFESVASLEENHGSGCVLAHCMGLGKTLQVITLIVTLMKNDLGVNSVLILCPLNVVNNWIQEFELWLSNFDHDLDLYDVINYRKNAERFLHIRKWHREGGILILSYDLMRNLTKDSSKTENLEHSFSEFLIDPGPDLVICDEGHIMKNEGTSLSKCIRRIKTSRRIILTGTPLQNNLLEYHSMIQFIKPNILGTKKEFVNRFVNPIMNGQFEDSNERDVKIMRARSHVLHKLLDGCIQRFSYAVLMPFLPEKHEYVISIRLTETQSKLYQFYVEKCRTSSFSVKTKLFSDFHRLQKIWTHPKMVAAYMEECESFSVEDDELSCSDESVVCLEPDANDAQAYWKEVIKPEEYEDIASSGKLVILFHILKQCRKLNEKVLVFSQSLKNLNLIEDFLGKVHLTNVSAPKDIRMQYVDTWIKDVDYFRMDGSSSSDMRKRWCKYFNNERNVRGRLFLISTKAGGLGINLIAANRVVIFDASWNPSHDVQSIFRVYRFGQKKPCYIYRFVAEATMEEKIYERQVTKVSLEKRVLDEHQIERHYSMGNLLGLYKYEPMPREKWPVPKVPRDRLLAEILNVHKDWIVRYHEHDSLLENKEDEEMTESERKAAWEDFEKERFMMENDLDRRAQFNVGSQVFDKDAMTREILQLTKMYRASMSNGQNSLVSPPEKSTVPVRTVNSRGCYLQNTNDQSFQNQR